VPWSPSLVFSERQAPVHANPTFGYLSFEYSYLFITLSCRSWVKTLATHILSCPEIILQILFTVWERGICLAMVSMIEVGWFTVIREL
jgi:hypothetical protein